MENYFLAEEYENRSEKPTFTVVHGIKEMMEIVDDAKENKRFIVVYKLGECLIDWS